MSWAPQPPGSWPYFQLINQRVEALYAEAEREHLARLSRRARSRRTRDRARRWLGRPLAVASRVNDLIGWLISPGRARTTDRAA